MGAPKWRQQPDSNQGEVVRALVKIGCTCYDASRIGGGFPDLVVGYRGLTCLLELKTEKGKLNKKQQAFHESWTGFIATVRSPMQAIEAVTQHVKDHPSR